SIGVTSNYEFSILIAAKILSANTCYFVYFSYCLSVLGDAISQPCEHIRRLQRQNFTPIPELTASPVKPEALLVRKIFFKWSKSILYLYAARVASFHPIEYIFSGTIYSVCRTPFLNLAESISDHPCVVILAACFPEVRRHNFIVVLFFD